MRKMDRILEEFPELEPFRERFGDVIPEVRRLGPSEVNLSASFYDTGYRYYSHEVYFVFAYNKAIQIWGEVWRAIEDYGIPDILVSLLCEQDRNQEMNYSATIYVRPRISDIKGEVEFLIRQEIDRLRDIADGDF